MSAVLTGDLVGSTGLERDEITAAMAALASYGDKFCRFRGDGWQVFLADATKTLRTVLLIRADLRTRNITTRISIGIGDVDHLGDMTDATGTAFSLSGRGLDAMPKRARLAGAPSAVFTLADWIAERWSAEQAQAMTFALSGVTQKEMAARLGVSHQAVHARLRGAGWAAIAPALAGIEAA